MTMRMSKATSQAFEGWSAESVTLAYCVDVTFNYRLELQAVGRL